MTELLSASDLSLRYGEAVVLSDVSFTLARGESLGIAGESGSGKSQLVLAIMGLLPAKAVVTGTLSFENQPLLSLPESARRKLRGARMGLIFQDPMTSLNPYLTIGAQLAEVLEVHRGASRDTARAAAVRMLEVLRVRDAATVLDQHPHALSGGMRQRVMIAMMLLAEPALLIADEPTTALDVTVQAEILRLLASLRRELGLSLVLISHDLGVLAEITDQLLVLYGGQTMERGATRTVLAAPRHPYTRALLACRPTLRSPLDRPLPSIPGFARRPGPLPGACVFAARCGEVISRCHQERPALFAAETSASRCWLQADTGH